VVVVVKWMGLLFFYNCFVWAFRDSAEVHASKQFNSSKNFFLREIFYVCVVWMLVLCLMDEVVWEGWGQGEAGTEERGGGRLLCWLISWDSTA